MTRTLTILRLALAWIFAALFVFLSLGLLGMGGWLQALLVFAIALLLLPVMRPVEKRLLGRTLPWWGRSLAGVGLWVAMVLSVVLSPAESIYKTKEDRQRFAELYRAELAQWPVPHESRFVQTSYGRIHVIASGPDDAPPVLLINASGLAGWSWRPNVAALAEHFRTYAIDNIGEVGLNELENAARVPKTPAEVTAYYKEVADGLGVDRAHVVGASIGGYITTTYALGAPERVGRIVLLGPMGYGSTMKTVLTMTLAQGFPFDAVQDTTFRWAFGDAAHVQEMFGTWFRLLMDRAIPNPIPPSTLTPEQLSRLQAPTLAFFGTRDGVVGDAGAAAALARNIPNATVKIVDSGHLIGAELPEIVNQEMVAFLQPEPPASPVAVEP